jgi:hypothetical protein
MIAASGAMTVGFGAKQSIDESRLLPMLFVTLGMAFAAFLGVVIGHTNFFLVAMAALWGFGYGMLTTREAGYSWVGQQCVIAFLVASAFPASVEAAGTVPCLSLQEERFRFSLPLFCFAPMESWVAIWPP